MQINTVNTIYKLPVPDTTGLIAEDDRRSPGPDRLSSMTRGEKNPGE